MTRAARLADATRRLVAAGVEGAARDARLLLRAAGGLEGAAFSAALGEDADPAEIARFEALVAARLRRQPMGQILGRREFWGRTFRVTPDVLDPRPETETLVEAALARGPRTRVLDLGTGSGALLLTLLAEWTGARGVGTDISAAALAVAARNAVALGIADRASFLHADWFDGVEGQFDLIVANPPYIPAADLPGLAPEVRDWEPHGALSPGADGISAIRNIAAGLRVHMAKGCVVLVEFGVGQGAVTQEILSNATGCPVILISDLSNRPRAALVQG